MSIIDLFFPRQVKCIFCSSETKEFGICDKCYESLPFLTSPICHNCGGKLIGKGKVCIECKGRHFDFDRSFAVLSYEGDVQDKIISFKQNGNKYIGETFAWLIDRKFHELYLDIDIIIPVPISEERTKERGFNQSEVLCVELLSTGLVDTGVIKRVVDTPHQTGLSRENRENNLKDCFKVIDKKKIKGKNVLLIDDIYTTGSTLNECSKTLKKNGVNKVFALCLARPPIRMNSVVEEINVDKKNSLAYNGE